jgi:hypothetical protein
VIGADGVLLSTSAGAYVSYSSGLFPVLGQPRRRPRHRDDQWPVHLGVAGRRVGFKSPISRGPAPPRPGHVALADFGAYGTFGPEPLRSSPWCATATRWSTPSRESWRRRRSRCRAGAAAPPRWRTSTGTACPSSPSPGQAYYTIYDIDCSATPRPGGTCPAGRCDFGPCPRGASPGPSTTQDLLQHHRLQRLRLRGRRRGRGGLRRRVLRPRLQRQDRRGRSSANTAPRAPGTRTRSSPTWTATTARIWSPSNKACSPNGDGMPCMGLTPEGRRLAVRRPPLPERADCVSGTCDAGLCRCTTSGQCCAAGGRRDLPRGGLMPVRAAPRRHARRRQHLPRRASRTASRASASTPTRTTSGCARA